MAGLGPLSAEISEAMRFFLAPGDIVCDLFGLPATGDHRQILRSFFNMLFWGFFAATIGLMIAM